MSVDSGASIHGQGERTIRKSLVRDRGSIHVFFDKKKTGLLRPLAFPSPLFLIPLVLCAELSDKNRESRSVDRGCRGNDSGGTFTKPERFSSVHGDICIPSIAFKEMFIASSSVKRISSRHSGQFFCRRARSRVRRSL